MIIRSLWSGKDFKKQFKQCRPQRTILYKINIILFYTFIITKNKIK